MAGVCVSAWTRRLTIRDGHLSWQRRTDRIEEEARLDGIYVIRTSVPAEYLNAAETVQAYKDLLRAERAVRSLKTVDLEIRPIRHWTAPECALVAFDRPLLLANAGFPRNLTESDLFR